MFGRKKHRIDDSRLDLVGREILRAAALDDEESGEATSSPFLLTRIRARVAEGGEPRGVISDDWLSLFPAFRRAVPVMVLVAMFAVGASWYLQPAPGAGRGGQEFALSPDPDGLTPISACAISTKDECAISTEEVLATLVNGEGQERRK